MHERRIAQKQRIVGWMIAIYCRRKHPGNSTLCPDCAALLEYANRRSQVCPNVDRTLFCSGCQVHCYRDDMQEKIRSVMRFSGPRMLLYHPITAWQHLLSLARAERRRA